MVVDRNTCPVAVPGVGIVAENGCFTQTRETNQEDARDVDRRAGEPKFHVEKAL